MRNVSLNFRNAVFAQESGEVGAFLLTITHPSLDTPIRLSTDPTQRLSTTPLSYGTVSRGNTFLYVGAWLVLPDEQEKSAPTAKMGLSNVTRSVVATVRSITSPPQVMMEAILASEPDIVEFTVPAFDMVNVQYDVNEMTFDLAIDSLVNEPFPAGIFGPAGFPGLFV